jgi:hypothetical protein
MEQDSKLPNEYFLYCFYHVYSLRHTNYHHVLMKIKNDDLIKVLDTDHYQYRLISATPVYLDEEEQAKLIIRGLIMDGESLLKRFKAQEKNPFKLSN